MPLTEPGAVLAQDQGEVRKDRRRITHGLIEVDLAGGVVEVIIPPDNVGDLHEGVVYHDHKVIGGAAVAAHDDEIIQFFVVEDDLPFDEVINNSLPFIGGFESNDRGKARRLVRALAAAPIVFWFVPLSQCLLAPLIQLFVSAVAAISLPRLHEPFNMLSVQVYPPALKIGAFIPVQPYPLKAV
jgi:hypothetical protein